MECLRAAELISAAADGELLDAAELAEARLHCASCPECRPLEALLARLATATAPEAPPALVTQLDALAAAAARDMTEDELARALVEAAPTPHPRRRWEWAPRLAAFASAAAVLLVALTAGSVALLNQRQAADQAFETADTASMKEESATLAAPSAGETADSAASRGASLPAPEYVVFDGVVWRRVELPPTASLLEVGMVRSDLGSGAVSDHSAYQGDAADVLYVQSDGPDMLAFAPVVRYRSGIRYSLVASEPLTLFGAWPTLPPQIAQPVAADGSPALARAGFDDIGRDIFTLRTGSVSDGFAVAPGTDADDPAAGNPNWTWWEKR